MSLVAEPATGSTPGHPARPVDTPVDTPLDTPVGVGARAGLAEVFELFWHPVCTLDELAAAAPHPRRVRLLGRDLAVARLADGTFAALADRCIHRSARLSVGWVDGTTLRCAYHGWAFGAHGRCAEIPSMPDDCSAAARSTSLHVHVLTRMPARWQRSIIA